MGFFIAFTGHSDVQGQLGQVPGINFSLIYVFGFLTRFIPISVSCPLVSLMIGL